MRLEAVIFDWAGTIVDQGSRAPIVALQKIFEDAGVPVSEEEAAAPMGLPKREHIQVMLAMPRIADAWVASKGTAPQDTDVDALYSRLNAVLLDVVAEFAAPIPGALDVVAALRARGIKIGSTTGYSRAIMERLAPAAAKAGYAPDALVCADDVPNARPGAGMMYRCLLDLGAPPARACVKVDDTPVGIEEGIAAGCWTIGVTASGTTPDRKAFDKVGTHLVIDTVADLLPALETLRPRIAAGEAP